MRTILLVVFVTITAALGSASVGDSRQETAAPHTSARVWEGRAAEYEAFIAAAPIERFEDLSVGVTHPRRAFLRPGGLVESVAWKVLPPGRVSGSWESYKSEVAAYEMDKLLNLGMVPVAVEKQWKHEIGAAILWLTPVRSWKEVRYKEKPDIWNRQMVRMKMFDDLIGNNDRNLGNLVVDDQWNVFLIDHSRAFVTDKDLPAKIEHVDRALWNRMLALDEPALTPVIRKWVGRAALSAVLARRDRMRDVIAKLVQTNGERAVFVQ